RRGGAGGGPRPRHGGTGGRGRGQARHAVALEGGEQSAQVGSWKAGADHRLCLGRGRRQLAEQGGHRGTLVDEDTQVVLGRTDDERLGQGSQRFVCVAGGGNRERPQRLHLDETAYAVLGHGQVTELPEQPQG